MEQVVYKLIGLLASQKEATTFTRLIMETDFSNWQVDNAKRCEGINVEIELTTMDCTSLKVGDQLHLFYSKGFQGKAKLAGYSKVTK